MYRPLPSMVVVRLLEIQNKTLSDTATELKSIIEKTENNDQ